MRRVVVVAVALLVAGCSSSAGEPASGNSLDGSITVDAAASLTEAFDALQTQFQHLHPGSTVKITYGASSRLATQIGQGAPVDVFASASETNMTQLGNAAPHPTDFVSNTGEIAVPPGNPAHIRSVADLARPGVKVAVCAAAVPCGVVATEVFQNAGITVHPAASLSDVKTTLAAVESGEVDAGLVYVTDVRAAGDKVAAVPIPASLNAKTTYPIAVLRDAKKPALADAFVQYVLSSAGRKVLTADGFSPP